MLTHPALLIAALLGNFALPQATRADPPGKPNVVLIVTDDQGYGDLGLNHNPAIHTPRLDQLARDGVRLRSFYVTPVCSPTRACLMTGRYNQRTGVVDTFRGRSILHPDEVTLAEALGPAGYRTGIFGKWHLGDNTPSRAIDQGFAEAILVKGGGVGQASDPPGGGKGNFDPILQHNGLPEPSKGYTTDLFTDAAIRFIEAQPQRPFFVTLSYNVPHVPLDVPSSEGKSLAPGDVTGRIYAMMASVDQNVGRLLDRLDQLGLGDNTIVWFLSDNGPEQKRLNEGLRGLKGTVYEGGIRVPSFLRWRAGLPRNREVTVPTAHIDVMPTLLAACDVEPPASVRFDGVNLLPLLRDPAANPSPPAWADRNLFFQWHRGDTTERFRHFAVRGPRFKLVQAFGATGSANVDPPPLPNPLPLELYDIPADPGEQTNLAASHPEEVQRLKRAYEAWFADVSAGQAERRPRITLGSDREAPTVLTRQDYRGVGVSQHSRDLGGWDVQVVRPGRYDLDVVRDSTTAGTLHVEVGAARQQVPIAAGVRQVRVEGLPVAAGPARVRAWVEAGPNSTGAWSVSLSRRDGSDPPAPPR